MRAHSVGDVYPVVIVHFGDDSAGLIVGSTTYTGLPKQYVDELAAAVKWAWDNHGVKGARSLAYQFQSTYRYSAEIDEQADARDRAIRVLFQPPGDASDAAGKQWKVQVRTPAGLEVTTSRLMILSQAQAFANYLRKAGSVQAAAVRLVRHNIYQICNE